LRNFNRNQFKQTKLRHIDIHKKLHIHQKADQNTATFISRTALISRQAVSS